MTMRWDAILNRLQQDLELMTGARDLLQEKYNEVKAENEALREALERVMPVAYFGRQGAEQEGFNVDAKFAAVEAALGEMRPA